MSVAMLMALTYGVAIVASVVALMLDAFGSRRAAIWSSAAGLAVAGGIALASGLSNPPTLAWRALYLGGAYGTVAGVVWLLAAFAVVGGSGDMGERAHGGSSAALIILGATGSVAVASAADLTMLLIALETAAVCGYALVVTSRTRRGDEAAMKYFVQGAIATGLFVLGMAVLVGGFMPGGSLASARTAILASGFPLVAIVGAVPVLAALAFKAGAAPFHSWAPDVYENAPADASSFLAAGPKVAAIAALALVASALATPQLQTRLAVLLAAVAVVSVLIGSLAALRQRSYTRMLGYAGVAQMGYAAIGAALLSPMVATFFAATYAVASTGTFMAASAFRRSRPEWDGSIDGLSGMGREAPLLGGALAVLLVSLAGIPPLLGFWGKFVVFLSAIAAAQAAFAGGIQPGAAWAFSIAAAVGIVGSIVSLGYYGNVLRTLFSPADSAASATGDVDAVSGDPAEFAPGAKRVPSAAVWCVVLLAVTVIVLGVVPLFVGYVQLPALFAFE